MDAVRGSFETNRPKDRLLAESLMSEDRPLFGCAVDESDDEGPTNDPEASFARLDHRSFRTVVLPANKDDPLQNLGLLSLELSG